MAILRDAPYGNQHFRVDLGTVQRADEIMILEHGRIAERGPRAALAADSGSRFAHLLRTGMEEVLA